MFVHGECRLATAPKVGGTAEAPIANLFVIWDHNVKGKEPGKFEKKGCAMACSVFNGQAATALKYGVGDLIEVAGELVVDTFVPKNGSEEVSVPKINALKVQRKLLGKVSKAKAAK